MSETTSRPAARILRRDGSYNIERRGLPRARIGHDVYHRLLSMRWAWLILWMGFLYVVANTLFACAYLLLGDAIENARPGSFADAFFFSVQTMATIGYGKLVPKGLAGNLMVTVEALLGMGSLAVYTGLLFAKFSRPTARVRWSRYAVVTSVNGLPTLMLRVANERDSMMLSASMKMYVVRSETSKEGTTMRRFHDLVLVRSETPIFPLSWTVSHPIDEKSPLYGLTAEDIARGDMEVICVFTGIEETMAAPIHTRFSYSADDIRFGHRFVDIVGRLADGGRFIDYTRFNDVEPELPVGEATE